MRSTVLIIFFIILFPFCSTAQINKVIIFKWETDLNGNENRTLIEINSTGNIYVNSKHVDSLDIIALTEDFNKLISDKRLVKSIPDNDLPEEVSNPENGTQQLFISIFMLEDFMKGYNYVNDAKYLWQESHSAEIEEYTFYKYLNDKNLKIIKTYLSNLR